MDYLDLLEDEPEGQEPTWWVTLLDPDPAAGLPECRWEVCYMSAEDVDRVARQVRKRNQALMDYTANQRKELRVRILPKFVRGWEGMTYRNLQRLSEWALRRPELARKFEDKSGNPIEIDFNERNLEFVAKKMEHVYYNLLVNTATSTEEAVVEMAEKKSGSSTSSAASSPTSSPRSTASADAGG